MGRIKQLSKHLINQIAAGEVIERPASVVKELVENSIDAGATKISVDITNECRDIRVADNGSGIHKDDVLLAFSKHATSKIASDEDLFAINTLGFRGEALSSIISISKLTCITRTKDSDNGTKVECENSEVTQSQTGCAVGTIMEIKDLFYNLPARLKFLKKPQTEFSYIQEILQTIAIVHPQISFELKLNGKNMLKTSGLNDLPSTICEIYSDEVMNNMVEVFKTDKISNFRISGYITTPNYTRSSKKFYNTYINSRAVKCQVIQKAIDMADKTLIGIGKYPIVVLNLEIPPEDVDVNVHPTKKEVRYKNTNQIFNFVYSAVSMAFSNIVENDNPIYALPQAESNIVEIQKETAFVELPNPTMQEDTFLPIQETFLKPSQSNELVKDIKPQSFEFPSKSYTEENERSIDIPEFDENIIGQYHRTYILIECEEGLEIVDQHIADERYIYEKLKNQKQAASQLLFLSDVHNISPTEAELIRENKPVFERFGYEIEFLKDNEIIFKKVPQMLSKIPTKELLADILENPDGTMCSLEEKILITTSCKAAIKANEKLSTWQMQEIIRNWRKTPNNYTCPHGRPISRIIPHKDIASFFERNA